jgi:outer membrane protein TolC
MPSRAAARTICLALAVVPGSLLDAQNPPRDSLTLGQALSIATAHAPRLRARESAIQGARSGVTLSNERLLPSFDVGGQIAHATDNNITGASFPQPTILPVSGPVRPATDGAPIYGNGFGALLAWTPFTFGQTTWQRRQARSELGLALDNASGELFEVQVRVSAAYLELLRQQELIRVQQQSLARADALALSVRTLVANGLRPAADSLLAMADVSRARIDVFTARRNTSNAQSVFSELLGIDAPPAIAAAPFLDPLPSDADTTTLSGATPVDLSKHPRLKPFISRVAVSEAHEAVMARSSFPRVSFLGGLAGRGSGIAPNGTIDRSFSGAFSGERVNLATGVMVSVPLMDAFFTGPRTAVERIRTDADRAELTTEQDHLRAQLASSNADFGVAALVSREAPIQLAAAAAAYRQMNARYAAGLATQAELAQAQYLLTRAETDALVARIGAWTAWLNLCAARGDLAPFLRSVK